MMFVMPEEYKTKVSTFFESIKADIDDCIQTSRDEFIKNNIPKFMYDNEDNYFRIVWSTTLGKVSVFPLYSTRENTIFEKIGVFFNQPYIIRVAGTDATSYIDSDSICCSLCAYYKLNVCTKLNKNKLRISQVMSFDFGTVIDHLPFDLETICKEIRADLHLKYKIKLEHVVRSICDDPNISSSAVNSFSKLDSHMKKMLNKKQKEWLVQTYLTYN